MPSPKIYGLIGFPVKHSFSALMQNAAFKAAGIEAEYKLFAVKPDGLCAFFAALDKENIFGFNVTIPHKEKALQFVSLDKANSRLKEIGAINTVVRKDNTLFGYNTDIIGFSKHIKENIDPKEKRAAVLGAGGAGRAVSFALANEGASEIALFDIDRERAQKTAQMLKNLFCNLKVFSVDYIDKLNLPEKDILINATPVGMKEEDPLLIKEELLHKDLFVYELIYNPPKTKLLGLCAEKSLRHANGSGMLLYQGAESFRLWTEKQPPLEVMKKALEEAGRNDS